jgi:ABC-type amino acid transport substrate-binding protein
MRSIIMAILLVTLLGATNATADTIKRIKDNGEIRIGYRQSMEPFSFEGQDGQAVGYSIDLCKRVATAVQTDLGLKDLKTTFVPVTLSDRFDAVASGKIDILCAASTITLGRMEKVDFSVMTFVTGGGIMSRESSAIRNASELAGKKIAVAAGTTAETAFATFLKDNFIEADLVKADSLEAAKQKLEAGEVDAVAGDQIALIGQMVASGDPRAFVLAEDLYSYEPYGLAMARGDAEFALIVNRALVRTYRTGQFKGIYDQWFGRIGLRPTPVLQAMFAIFSFPE